MAVRPPIPRIHTGSDVENVRNRQATNAINDVLSSPWGSGNFATLDGKQSLTLSNGAVNKLIHGLGHSLQGWILTSLSGATSTGRVVQVHSDGNETADGTRDLWLDVQGHGADIKAKVWVW